MKIPKAEIEEGKIKPQLGSFDLTMIVVSLVIGMGIFSTPHQVAVFAKIPMIFFLVWGTGAVVSLFGALTFAEIGSRYPAAGGFYKIFSHCYHPAFAFMVNWITVISNAASTAGVALMGADYIAPLLLPDMHPIAAARVICITTICFLFVINFLGIKVSAKMLNGLMLVKIGLLLFLIFAIFSPHEVVVKNIQADLPSTELWKAFALCFVPVFFTYGGYQQTMNFGSDINNPSRTMPRAIFIGMGIVFVLYLSVNYAYYHVLGFEQLQNSKTLAADVANVLLGPIAFKVIAVLMFFSVMAYVNVSVMSNPRIYYAMAEDGVLPPILKRVNQRTQVQEWALTLFCIFIIATLFFLDSFKDILNYVMFFDSISLITAASAIFILRKRARGNPARTTDIQSGGDDKDGIFKMKGYPYLTILYIVVYLGVMVSVFMANKDAFYGGGILFISGLPLFYLVRALLTRTT